MLQNISANNFINFMEKLLPYLIVLMFVFVGIGVYIGLFNSPSDYQQGDTVRIMYVHVPSAYLGLGAYLLLFTSSIFVLVYKSLLAEILASSSAFLGMIFTFICLITGSIWGNPMWGTWWVWDARLTSMLILFFIYIAYIIILKSFNSKTGYKIASVFALLGGVNIPIIKFSVDWWSTLHQPASIFRAEGSSVPIEMLVPLMLMLVGFSFIFVILLTYNIRYEYNIRKIKNIIKNER